MSLMMATMKQCYLRRNIKEHSESLCSEGGENMVGWYIAGVVAGLTLAITVDCIVNDKEVRV